jgi:serine phosphatase RsbU (regulator of sigma subunit)
MYGNQRLHARLKQHAGEGVSAIIDAVRASWLDFGRGAPPADDVTLVGIELKA